ncbi:MAG: cob(I)yrinic acid a,c-diamide adenosyltransferase [Desulfatirhabdiaceae bacterium]
MQWRCVITVYTGRGDSGETSLFSGERVYKDDDRVEAFGDLDELISILGVVVSHLQSDHDEMITQLKEIMADLFRIGALLATSPDSPVMATLEKIPEDHIRRLEEWIDKMNHALPPLTGFILPVGHVTSAWAHVARTVCRRVERKVVRLISADHPKSQPQPLHGATPFLNRLSDYLFILARYCNRINGIPDSLLKP